MISTTPAPPSPPPHPCPLSVCGKRSECMHTPLKRPYGVGVRSRRRGDCWCQTLWLNESERKNRSRNSRAPREWRMGFFFLESEGWGGGKLPRPQADLKSADRAEMVPLATEKHSDLKSGCLCMCGGTGSRCTAGICV